MLTNLLRCPYNFVSSSFLKEKIDPKQKVRSFALKSGALEFSLFHNGYDITVSTNRYYVWEFWRCLINSPHCLLKDIEFFHKNTSSADMSYFKDSWFTHFEDPYERSALYYLLNRYSKTGILSDTRYSKNNFSKLNLSFFESTAPMAKDLNLVFDQDEELTNLFDSVGDDHVILVPVGEFKRDGFLKTNVKTIDTPSFDNKKLREYIKLHDRKIILIYKYDEHVDRFYNNKTYINKLGFITEKPELAEDLIVSNF